LTTHLQSRPAEHVLVGVFRYGMLAFRGRFEKRAAIERFGVEQQTVHVEHGGVGGKQQFHLDGNGRWAELRTSAKTVGSPRSLCNPRLFKFRNIALWIAHIGNRKWFAL